MDLRGQLGSWVAEVANKRVHGTTHRVVAEAWEEEKAHLQPRGARPSYPLLHLERRQISADAFVDYRTNRYPVPWEAAGKEAYVHLLGDTLHILHDNQRLVSHPLCLHKHQTLEAGKLHEGMPFGGGRSRRKPMICLTPAGPQVEQRSLEAYAEAAGCPAEERAA